MDSDLIDELAALRRGRGVRRPNPRAWIGPRLKEMLTAHAASAATGDDLRRALVEELRSAVKDLPQDLATAYLAANAIAGSDAPLLGERLELVGSRQDRHPRTVRRRLAEADELVAAALARRGEVREAEDAIFRRGWHLDKFSVELRLDLPRPVHLTRRTIRVVAPTLAEITDVFGLPHETGEAVRVEALEGCVLIESVQVSDSVWRSRFALPRVLHEGETHSVGIGVEVPSLEHVEPFVIMAPVRACREFSCRIVVGDSRAHGFERINGVPVIAMQDPGPIGELVASTDGVVTASFREMSPGLAYGIRWAR
ncbi:hypothetical protein [Granulicoccus sp. GXG6511]|uniref:hypothetical protein n=1 Tax=Granulicoccus sp. GXG6511 TaxID=3381351 RepID=UPI003D7C5344